MRPSHAIPQQQTRRRERDRDISVGLASLLACGLLAGCGNSNPGAGAGANGATVRYQPTGAGASVPECAETSLLLSSPQLVAVDASHCDAETCRWTYQVNDGDTLTFDGGNSWVFLRFDTSIAGATTTAQLAAAFRHVNFYRTFPVSGSSMPLSAMYFEARTSVDGFDVFELAGGRLHVKLTFTIEDPYATIWSQAGGCSEGDEIGICPCVYGGVDVPGTIDIDLPANVP
jgi:hypothetical protein